MATDVRNRAATVKELIQWVERRADEVTRFLRLGRAGAISPRTTHNDTKFNNVLLDATTDEAVCVIDLDTVMPGFVLYDFGDSVRTVTNTGAEDEEDLSKVRIDLDLFRAFTAGYLSEADPFLTDAERENLAFSGIVMTYTIGIRFFTDYLEGDNYFKIHYPDQNLRRSKTQFRLIDSMEERYDEMCRIVSAEHRTI